MLSVDVYYWANKSNGLCILEYAVYYWANESNGLCILRVYIYNGLCIFCHHESFYKASRVFCVDEIVSALHVLFCDIM